MLPAGRRISVVGWLVALAVGCSPSAPPSTVGAAGGTVTIGGVTLDVPAGALSKDTTLTVTPGTAPAGYVVASAVYEFGPAGTTFARPVTVSLPLTTSESNAHLFWSNASGGFDDLGGTLSGGKISGRISHFSTGFAGTTGTSGGTPGSGACGSATYTGSCLVTGTHECFDYYGTTSAGVTTACGAGTVQATPCDPTDELGDCVSTQGGVCIQQYAYPPADAGTEASWCRTHEHGTWTAGGPPTTLDWHCSRVGAGGCSCYSNTTPGSDSACPAATDTTCCIEVPNANPQGTPSPECFCETGSLAANCATTIQNQGAGATQVTACPPP